MLALRPQDPLPEWITHVAFVGGQNVDTMERTYYTPHQPHDHHKSMAKTPRPSPRTNTKEELLSLKDVRVQYGDRKVRPIPLLVHIY